MICKLKRCSQCKIEKSSAEFSKNKRSADKLAYQCKSCVNAYTAKWREANREKLREYALAYAEGNRERLRAKAAAYREANGESVRRTIAAWRKSNRKYRAATSAKDRADKLQATPAWADLCEIKKIYARCPKGWHVDHIVPLKGKIVCGLHVHWNLQLLPARENMSKGNRLIGTVEDLAA